jgi:hypothetical protein
VHSFLTALSAFKELSEILKKQAWLPKEEEKINASWGLLSILCWR